jgi:hypothetical protein
MTLTEAGNICQYKGFVSVGIRENRQKKAPPKAGRTAVPGDSPQVT